MAKSSSPEDVVVVGMGCRFPGSATSPNYEAITLRDIDTQPELASTGNGTAILSNRISYFFDLRGPSVTVDTACSGSLVAIDLAIQSLKSGSVDLAIVGGVNMILTPDTMFPMSSMGFLSPAGKCFAFDSRASGYGRGEGAGIVILKRITDAQGHNDPIRAVIVGHGVNQDGRTSGKALYSPTQVVLQHTPNKVNLD
ncbi:hypothetical protein TD95_001223 [Thielaviopsis punctulata]|uniref:Ketosynthase family 3 (KS3) domain-containing protein n=1 Tax=Thielaviopsis punctulata TaxID=72032 RepID=A0A0F4ZCJ5_9PEZI|nr:hypothetical protein TD95_001223 [Thielaviopsis punctulata]